MVSTAYGSPRTSTVRSSTRTSCRTSLSVSARRMPRRSRKAKVADVHEIASAMPHVTRWGDESRPVYQVGGKSFIFFRTPRPDASTPRRGSATPTSSCSGSPTRGRRRRSSRTRTRRTSRHRTSTGTCRCCCAASRIGELTRDEVAELVQDAWLSPGVGEAGARVPGLAEGGDSDVRRGPDSSADATARLPTGNRAVVRGAELGQPAVERGVSSMTPSRSVGPGAGAFSS